MQYNGDGLGYIVKDLFVHLIAGRPAGRQATRQPAVCPASRLTTPAGKGQGWHAHPKKRTVSPVAPAASRESICCKRGGDKMSLWIAHTQELARHVDAAATNRYTDGHIQVTAAHDCGLTEHNMTLKWLEVLAVLLGALLFAACAAASLATQPVPTVSATSILATQTAVAPTETATPLLPTATAVPPTSTSVLPSPTPRPTETATAAATETAVSAGTYKGFLPEGFKAVRNEELKDGI
jgi:hypothetical protein